MALYSFEIEKHLLGGLIQNPEVFTEIERFLNDKTFYSDLHGTIFSCFRSAFSNDEKIDKVLLAQKIKNLNIKFKGDIDIFSYIDAISFTQINAKATIEAAQELSKLHALRDLDSTCDKIKTEISKNVNQPLDKIVSQMDAIYGEKVSSFNKDGDFCLLGDGLLDLVEERGNNPVEEIGLSTPYPEFNRMYGGLRNKNLYIIAARAKSGKSTFLNDMVSEMSKFHKIPVLVLDTEMSTEETKFRMATAKSGVPLWYLETGNWRKNPTYVEKVRQSLKNVKGEYRVYHYHVGNKKIEEIASICRRWYLKFVGRGNKGLICFDYIKAIDKLTGNQQEYQLMGDKVDMLKKLAEELDIPIVSAVQTNRTGITTNKDSSEIIDDESTIGLSDRITWYATYVGILRRRTSDEIVLDTLESGTHKLIEAVSRWQGKDAAGHQDLIKRTFPDGKTRYIKNFVNIDIQNFKVSEKGSLKDCIARQNAQFKIRDDEKPDSQDETL
jgi:replicative DNA helicase